MRMTPLFLPHITTTDRRAVDKQIRTDWIGPGRTVELFEEKLCEAAYAENCVATSSGTAAILAALIAINRGHNAPPLLIAPGYGHPAAINAAAVLGYEVVLCDVSSSTGCMLRQRLVELVQGAGERGGVVAYTEHNGRVSGTAETFATLRDLHNWGPQWFFLQDSCQSLQNPHCRVYGDMAVLSFSPQKIVTTGQGGALLTDNAALAESVRIAISQGVRARGAMPLRPRFRGINLRMTDMQAAMGLSQLERLQETRKAWGRIRKWYGDDQENSWCPSVTVERPVDFIRDLAGEFVEAGMLYEAAALNLSAVGARKQETPTSTKLARQTVYLPAHHKVTYFHTRKVMKVLNAYV